ncbi:DNA internalization-related competence protein ComEC/Rec2 [Marinithermus hydrothermalis]|uniref:DNA internalization-related competence protein ComEC/Rec2 n=1 Tax=Marinithermus hydrothermalis (strain DSM 14884 / JCM 11576 / T1) TaxID=869210 RepID=F2NRB7_MARHT|nr:DNA internalization-related competence protein ComEC/Rec2 [Marinithermus hydrothermalis]AEB12966.1 DNA internalization-related competence protein ComEC/Rec2 [Marinithermus hydrothermalis DSM 14884]
MPFALAAGSLLAALLQLSPAFVLGAVLAFGIRPLPARWAFLAGFVLVGLRVLTLPDPWAPLVGRTVTLEGTVRDGFLYTERGRIRLDVYPPLADGTATLTGTVRRPQSPRNPGGFDEAGWLRGLGVRAVLEVARVEVHQPSPPGVKDRVRAALEAGLSPEAAALIRALTLGERRALGKDREAFQRAGLAHVLALSGLHVGILTGFLVLALAPLGPGRYLAALLVLWAYLGLVGPTPSLVRAVLMASAVLLALMLGKGRAPLTGALAFAFAVHVFLEPYAIFSLSFRLSYLAVLGLALTLPRLPPLRGVWGWVGGGVAVTLAAQALILPLVLHYFHQLPLLSPLTNLVAAPLVTLLVPLGFLKGILGAEVPLLGEVLALPVNLLAGGLLQFVRLAAQAPQLAWGEISPAGFALYYLALLPPFAVLYGYLRPARAAVLSATAVLAGLLPTLLPRAEVWQLDVGQGDSTLVRLPGGVEVLVDAGREWAGDDVVRALAALGVDELELAIGTHPDADHVGGLRYVLARVPVGALVLGPPKPGDPLDAALRTEAAAREIPVLTAARGATLRVGEATLRFLAPSPAPTGDDNTRSLVFVLEWRGRRVLFTGDAPTETERFWKPERVHVLKVSHHGARTGTGELVLSRFRPQLALIGVGPNPYGHPHPEVLARLERFGLEVHRTDREGAIRVLLW